MPDGKMKYQMGLLLRLRHFHFGVYMRDRGLISTRLPTCIHRGLKVFLPTLGEVMWPSCRSCALVSPAGGCSGVWGLLISSPHPCLAHVKPPVGGRKENDAPPGVSWPCDDRGCSGVPPTAEWYRTLLLAVLISFSSCMACSLDLI